jgi:hypothetical protein
MGIECTNRHLYRVIILSDNCPLLRPVGSFIVLAQSTQPTARASSGVAAEVTKDSCQLKCGPCSSFI